MGVRLGRAPVSSLLRQILSARTKNLWEPFRGEEGEPPAAAVPASSKEVWLVTGGQACGKSTLAVRLAGARPPMPRESFRADLMRVVQAAAKIVPPRIDITANLASEARLAPDAYDPDPILLEYIADPDSFDAQKLSRLWNDDAVRYVWRTRNCKGRVRGAASDCVHVGWDLPFFVSRQAAPGAPETDEAWLQAYTPGDRVIAVQPGTPAVYDMSEFRDLGATRIFYCVNLVEYDWVCADELTMRSEYSLRMFREMLLDAKCPVEVVFTHADKFAHKLLRVPFRVRNVRNDDYAGVDLVDALTAHGLDAGVASVCAYLRAKYTGAAEFHFVDCVRGALPGV